MRVLQGTCGDINHVHDPFGQHQEFVSLGESGGESPLVAQLLLLASPETINAFNQTGTRVIWFWFGLSASVVRLPLA